LINDVCINYRIQEDSYLEENIENKSSIEINNKKSKLKTCKKYCLNFSNKALDKIPNSSIKLPFYF